MATNSKGELLCPECEDGKVEVQGWEPWTTYLEDCEECDGRGTLTCPECGEAARVMGAEFGIGYCSEECARADENWAEQANAQVHPLFRDALNAFVGGTR
jgi:endogenous inhibitor of DNA gyrase (YacG/DUF329 family)